jgi:hypothetical protein
VKRDITLPAFYAAILGLLLGIRVLWREQERRRQLTRGDLARPVHPTGTSFGRRA